MCDCQNSTNSNTLTFTGAPTSGALTTYGGGALAPACGCAKTAAFDYNALADSIPYEHVDPRYFQLPPTMTAKTKMRIDLEGDLPGHLYGVVAPPDRCILDGSTTCWTVRDLQRDDPELEIVHQGDAVLADGTEIKIAALPGNIGHAPEGLSAEQARDWMSVQGLQVGRVRYAYHAEFGLVAAGIVWPEVVRQARNVASLRASPTSLDARWRSAVARIKESGVYRFAGAVFVNIPGLPLNRAASFADGFLLDYDGEDLVALGIDAPSLVRSASMSDTGTETPETPEPVMDNRRETQDLQQRVDFLEQTVAVLAKAEMDRQNANVEGLVMDAPQ